MLIKAEPQNCCYMNYMMVLHFNPGKKVMIEIEENTNAVYM